MKHGPRFFGVKTCTCFLALRAVLKRSRSFRIAANSRLTLLAIGLSASLSTPLMASSFAVTTTLDAVDLIPGDGVCATAIAACSLRAAISEANALAGADTIILPSGNFVLTIAGAAEDENVSGDLDISSSITLQGLGSAQSVIDGNTLDRVLDVHGADNQVALLGLTLRNGIADGAQADSNAGAGLRVGVAVQLQLSEVDVTDNLAIGTLGAIGIENFGCITGSRVRVIGNRLSPIASAFALAGGIATHGAMSCLNLDRSEISANVAQDVGGIYAEAHAPIQMRNSLIAGNVGSVGALLLNQNNTVVFENVTVSSNQGGLAAILNDGGSQLSLRNCTVTKNRAATGSSIVGGIMDVHGMPGTPGLVDISNSIVAGNGPGTTADDCLNIHAGTGGNIVGDSGRCRYVSAVGDQLDVDPQLSPLQDNGGATRSHLPGAAAIDHGSAQNCAELDQRGVTRPQDGDGDDTAVCDAGAVEIYRGLFADSFEAR